MTVRSGRGPRDPGMPTWRASDGRGSPPVYQRRRPGNGKQGFRIPGILRFLIFAGILASVVLIALVTVFRPLARAGIVDWAWQNTWSITRLPFVADFVAEDLGADRTARAGSDSTESIFRVEAGDTIETLAPRLLAEGYIKSERAFLYEALTTGLNAKLTEGTFILRKDMTPQQVADALVRARVVIQTTNVRFREGLRIEQMTALLQTLETGIDPREFYELATHPPEELLADYEWLRDILPEGASLEGFLYPDTYQVVVAANGGNIAVTDAEALIRRLLDRFHEVVGEERMDVPEERGLTFYQIVTLASIVEHEAVLDEERPLIAGVYQNRLDGLRGIAKILNADPTVTYAKDTMELAKLPFEEWRNYFFWKVPPDLANFKVPKELQGYQTYQTGGLIPGPISTPSLASIDAALEPDQEDGYLFFLAIPDTREHAFAKTLAEHNANRRKYGYT
ncbi:MAG TPA: endolytic transglycosylase MltG [Candidatus Binatia bacterium]|nr:endolytic transglycosylase MltG [Candidatus Binatia bacterium]